MACRDQYYLPVNLTSLTDRDGNLPGNTQRNFQPFEHGSVFVETPGYLLLVVKIGSAYSLSSCTAAAKLTPREPIDEEMISL